MARAEGLTCPTCGMVRAPTLAECPKCRAGTSTPSADLGETPLLVDESLPSLSSLPSRLALAAVPLLGCVTLLLSMRGQPRLLSYAQLGWVSSVLALLVAGLVAVLGTVVLSHLASRISWDGHSASPIALGAMMIFGVAPLVMVPTYRGIEAANVGGLESGPPENADCRWTEARQQISQRTGAVLHVTVHALCTLPSGAGLELDISLESASSVQEERLVVPTWRGRFWGRLVALPR
jgi:hypothetical protein